MSKELIATVDPAEWAKLSDEEKQRLVDAFNANINKLRASKGLPPLPKRPEE